MLGPSTPLPGRPGDASAPYNMALAGTPQKLNFGDVPVLSAHLDKLRLAVWCREPGEKLADSILGGAERSGCRRGRNRGSQRTMRTWALTPYGAYWQVDSFDGISANELVVEFNPAKMPLVYLGMLVHTWHLMGANGLVWCDRVDFATDYGIPRGFCVLDDARRLADHFGVGPWGPQTERTGFRRGSRLKFQLYDKRAEQASKGVLLDDDVTRFEVQCIKPPSLRAGLPLLEPGNSEQSLRLVDLPHLGWPGGDVCVRFFQWDPATVADREFGWCAWGARWSGLRCARNYARHTMGWRHDRWETFLAVMLPVMSPRGCDVWADRFRAAAAAIVGRLVKPDGTVADAPAWGEASGEAGGGVPAPAERGDPADLPLSLGPVAENPN